MKNSKNKKTIITNCFKNKAMNNFSFQFQANSWHNRENSL